MRYVVRAIAAGILAGAVIFFIPFFVGFFFTGVLAFFIIRMLLSPYRRRFFRGGRHYYHPFTAGRYDGNNHAIIPIDETGYQAPIGAETPAHHFPVR